MKHTKTMALAVLMTVGSANAAITTVDLQLSRRLTNGDTSSSIGAIAITTLNEGNSGGASQSILYTVTGLSLDSEGTGDDQITFTMGLTGTSSSAAVVGLGASFGAWGVNDGTGEGSLVEDDESLGFSFLSATVDLGAGATETAAIGFNGFTSFSALNVSAGETFDISGTAANDVTGASIASNGTVYAFTGTETAFTVEGNVGAMRYNLIQTAVTITTSPVPEPSSTTLLGLGGLALVLRRRR